MHIVAEALQKLGYDTANGMMYNEYWDDAETVVGQRVCNAGASTQWAKWCYDGRRTIFDADDNYFQFDTTNATAAQFFSQPNIRTRLMGNAYSAAYTTVCSENLASVFRQYCDNVVVIPNGLPEKFLTTPRPDHKKPVIGWVGTDSTIHELPIAAKALKQIADNGHTVHTVGIEYRRMQKTGLSGPNIKHSTWIQPNEAYLESIDFDIWAAPYRKTPYNECKGATKALEAAFLGIPIVASSITPYREFIRHGVTGFLADTHDEWYEYINTLIHDEELRKNMGTQARKLAHNYTIEKIATTHWAPVMFGRNTDD